MHASHEVVVETKPELLALVAAAESTHEAIAAIADVIAEQRQTLETLSGSLIETLSTGRAKADALGMMVDETIDRSHRFADEAAPKLVDALLRVRETAATAAESARETLAEVIPQAAHALEIASAEAMRRATGDTVERQVHAIVEATQGAVEAATPRDRKAGPPGRADRREDGPGRKPDRGGPHRAGRGRPRQLRPPRVAAGRDRSIRRRSTSPKSMPPR
jgi:hypothetical protein